MPSIHLTRTDRQTLLDHYRRAADSQVRLRSHILLWLAAGYPWVMISAVLFCSPHTINPWCRRFRSEGVSVVLGRPRGQRPSGIHVWAATVVHWVLSLTPADFRFARSRWSCEAVAVVLREDYRVRVGREPLRLWLRSAGLVLQPGLLQQPSPGLPARASDVRTADGRRGSPVGG